MKYGLLAGLLFTTASHASIDLKANEQPLPVTVDRQAVAKIPAGYKFVEPRYADGRRLDAELPAAGAAGQR